MVVLIYTHTLKNTDHGALTMNFFDACNTLNLVGNISEKLVIKAYRTLASKYHPDKTFRNVLK